MVIPGKNVVNLMLNTDLIEAVKKGEFHIYAVNTIDDGIGILTDVETGEQGEDGTYPEGSLNFIVNRKLTEMAEKMKKFQMQDKKASGNNSE